MNKELKYIFIALLSGILLFTHTTVLAQEDEPDPEPTQKEQEEQSDEEDGIDNTLRQLKEKIEDKVDEINKESKQIIAGAFVSLEDNIIELRDETDEIFSVAIDDTISTYFEATLEGSEEIDVSDIDENDYLIVSGPIIEDQISANIIYRQFEYDVGQGRIVDVDDDNNSIDVITSEKDEYTIEVDDDTVQRIIDTVNLNIGNATFNKYQVGDNVHFVIEKPDEDSTATAIRTLIIPQEYFVDEEVSPTEADQAEE